MAGQGLPIEGDLLNLGIGATTRKVPLRHLDFPRAGKGDLAMMIFEINQQASGCEKHVPFFCYPPRFSKFIIFADPFP